MEKLFKKELKSKKLIIDFTGEFELTKFEIKLIKFWINKKHDFNLPTVIPISERFSLDFIGWDNEIYNDVLLCKLNKRF